MNHDELSFVNQQLAGMLKSGVPLEGALRELSATMQRGALKAELTALEADLARGTPLATAISARKLPEFYVRMVQVGAQSGDLPGVLLMLADYYARSNALWTRLKALMVYPVIVLVVSLAVSVIIAFVLMTIMAALGSDQPTRVWRTNPPMVGPFHARDVIWAPVVAIALALLTVLALLIVPGLRRAAVARVPAFREARLAAFASAMTLLLRSGNTLKDALALMRGLERESHIGRELARWQELLASGRGKIRDLTASTTSMPPLFLWLLDQGGEDAAKGFAKAAEVYQARATHHIEIVLNTILPVMIVALGISVLAQVIPAFRVLQWMMWFD